MSQVMMNSRCLSFGSLFRSLAEQFERNSSSILTISISLCGDSSAVSWKSCPTKKATSIHPDQCVTVKFKQWRKSRQSCRTIQMSCLKEFSPFEKNVSAHLKNKFSQPRTSTVSQRFFAGMSRNLSTGIMFFFWFRNQQLEICLCNIFKNLPVFFETAI